MYIICVLCKSWMRTMFGLRKAYILKNCIAECHWSQTAGWAADMGTVIFGHIVYKLILLFDISHLHFRQSCAVVVVVLARYSWIPPISRSMIVLWFVPPCHVVALCCFLYFYFDMFFSRFHYISRQAKCLYSSSSYISFDRLLHLQCYLIN